MQEFYGESLAPDLIERIAGTDDDQLIVLAEQVVEDRNTLNSYPQAQQTLLDLKVRKPLVVESLLFPDKLDHPLSESNHLKRLCLFIPHLVVTDPIVLWAMSILPSEADNYKSIPAHAYKLDVSDGLSHGRRLARVLNGLAPVLPLIKMGVVVLADPAGTAWQGLGMNNLTVYAALAPAAKDVATMMLRNGEITEEQAEYIQSLDPWDEPLRLGKFASDFWAAEIDDDIVNYMAAEQILGTPGNDWQAKLTRAVAMSDYAWRNQLIPVTTTTPSDKFFRFEAQITGGGQVSADHAIAGTELPSVYATWSDVAALRASEEVFQLFRDGFLQALSSLDPVAINMDNDELAYALGQAMAEHISPTIVRLNRLRTRSTVIAKGIPKGVGTSISFAVKALGAPAVPGLSSAASTAGSKISSLGVGRYSTAAEAASIALRLIGNLRTFG